MQSVLCVCSAGLMTAAAGPDSIKPSSQCKHTSHCTLQVGQASAPMQELLGENLKQADNLRLGQLENGLRYVMLPNKVPPQRFEAHLEMHAGWYACMQACLQEGTYLRNTCLVFTTLLSHIIFRFLDLKQHKSCIAVLASLRAYTQPVLRACMYRMSVSKWQLAHQPGSRHEMNRCIQCRQCRRAAE